MSPFLRKMSFSGGEGDGGMIRKEGVKDAKETVTASIQYHTHNKTI